MKKFLLALVAIMALGVTGCEQREADFVASY